MISVMSHFKIDGRLRKHDVPKIRPFADPIFLEHSARFRFIRRSDLFQRERDRDDGKDGSDTAEIGPIVAKTTLIHRGRQSSLHAININAACSARKYLRSTSASRWNDDNWSNERIDRSTRSAIVSSWNLSRRRIQGAEQEDAKDVSDFLSFVVIWLRGTHIYRQGSYFMIIHFSKLHRSINVDQI